MTKARSEEIGDRHKGSRPAALKAARPSPLEPADRGFEAADAARGAVSEAYAPQNTTAPPEPGGQESAPHDRFHVEPIGNRPTRQLRPGREHFFRPLHRGEPWPGPSWGWGKLID